MTIAFFILGALTIAGMAGAMALRNAVHCILALTVGLLGLAGLFLGLGAQFVGFTQVLVYVGAVAILAVFAIMMTQGARLHAELRAEEKHGSSALAGGLVALGVFAILAWAMRYGSPGGGGVRPQPQVSVNQIGEALMQQYALPLEIMGLLLTAALIGAVIVAMSEKEGIR
jgi:NADH-quinone oxidoreductase subunit J